MASTYSSTPLSRSALSSTASRASLSSVKIGEGSFSPGDVIVESLLPRVRAIPQSTSSSLSSSSNAKQGMASSLSSSSPARATPFASAAAHDSRTRDGNNSDDTGIEVLALRDHPSVLRAQQECATLLNGNSVTVVEDEDVKEDVVQIAGRDAELVFPCRNIFQYVVFFVKDMEQYIEIVIDVLDDKQTYRQFKLTNARSLAKVDATTCQLPMVLGRTPGWRHMCVNLHDLTHRAFGAKHVTTVQLRVAGHCRLLRMFFQDERYSDSELPPHLTFLGQ